MEYYAVTENGNVDAYFLTGNNVKETDYITYHFWGRKSNHIHTYTCMDIYAKT